MSWPEILSTAGLIIGFFLAILAGSAVMMYIIISLCGLYFGRMWFKVQKTLQTPWFFIIFSVLLGFLLAQVVTRYGDPRIIVILFLIGVLVGFYLHKKGYLK